MTRKRRTTSIASDDRARIPFAAVGVLLLLSSVAIVGFIQARPAPESDIDPSLALDRGEAATQTAMKDAILDATDDVATSPVTTPADDGPFEELLGDDDASGDRVFRNYTALRVYREIHTRVDGTHHTIRDNATTIVTLPAIEDEDDARDAMDRVSFEAGVHSGDLDNGTVRVTVEDVSFEVRHEGDHVTTRTENVTVTVATPVFQLHERVSVYQDRLEMSMLDGGGFEGLGRKFAARTYPIVIGKSMLNYNQGNPSGAPFQEMVPHRQNELLANHAIYSVQSNTFGTRDPLWDRPTKAQALCWLAWEADVNYDRPGNASLLPAPSNSSLPNSGAGNSSNYEYFCEGAEFLFGDSTGTPGSVPSLWDIVTGSGNDNAMQGTEEVNYTVFAEQAHADILHGDGVVVDQDETDVSDENLSRIDEVDNENKPTVGFSDVDLGGIVNATYRTDLSVQSSGTGASLDVDPPTPSSIGDPDNWTHTTESSETVDLTETVTIDDAWRDRSDPSDQNPLLFTVDATDEVKLVEEHRWTEDDGPGNITRTYTDTGNATLHVEVRGTYASGAAITSSGEFEPHSGDVVNLFRGDNGIGDDEPVNFDEAPGSAFREAFNASRSSAGSTLESALDEDAHTSSGGVASAVNDPEDADGTEIGPDRVTSTSRADLEEFTREALDTGRERVIAEGPREYNRTDFITGNPFQDMTEHLRAQREPIVYADDGPFTAMPNFLRAEVLHRYHQMAVVYTAGAAADHGSERGDLSEHTEDGAIEEGVELAQDAVNRGRQSYGGTMNSSDLLGNVSFEVRGSPTYLEFDDVEREEVPAIRPAGDSARDVPIPDDFEFVPASACYNNRAGYFGIPLIPWPGSWYVTASSWGVDVEGEYARFEVTANVSEPSRTVSHTYVREDKNVSTTIGGTTAEIGNVEPIGVDTWAEFPMVVPAGKAGTGDPKHAGLANHDVETDEWNFTGPGWDEDEAPDAGC